MEEKNRCPRITHTSTVNDIICNSSQYHKEEKKMRKNDLFFGPGIWRRFFKKSVQETIDLNSIKGIWNPTCFAWRSEISSLLVWFTKANHTDMRLSARVRLCMHRVIEWSVWSLMCLCKFVCIYLVQSVCIHACVLMRVQGSKWKRNHFVGRRR